MPVSRADSFPSVHWLCGSRAPRAHTPRRSATSRPRRPGRSGLESQPLVDHPLNVQDGKGFGANKRRHASSSGPPGRMVDPPGVVPVRNAAARRFPPLIDGNSPVFSA